MYYCVRFLQIRSLLKRNLTISDIYGFIMLDSFSNNKVISYLVNKVN